VNLSRRQFLSALTGIATGAMAASFLPGKSVPEMLRGWEDLPEQDDGTFEPEAAPRWTQIQQEADASETILFVDEGLSFRANDVLVIPRTREFMRLVNAGGGGLLVVRGVCGTTPCGLLMNDWLLRPF
jgi:hypothetical protein